MSTLCATAGLAILCKIAFCSQRSQRAEIVRAIHWNLVGADVTQGMELHADQFDELVCDIASEETGDQLRRFVSAAHPSPKKSVLVDLGCGTGTFVQEFGRHFRQIFAADFATAVVRKAEKTHQGHDAGAMAGRGREGLSETVRHAVPDLAVCLNVITSPSAARRKSLWRVSRR